MSTAPSSTSSSNLPDELDAEVDRILHDKNFTSNSELYRLQSRDFNTLNPTGWLNDNVIDAYISLVAQTTPPDITIVPSFINSAIRSARISGMRMRENDVLFRLTKPYPNLMNSRLILMPINIGNTHWMAGAINLRTRTLTLYDSSQSAYQHHHEDIFWGIRNWLVNEGKRRQQPLRDLKLTAPQIPVPQQLNSYDCGIFTINFILACLQGNDSFAFNQSECSYLRRKMCWELAKGKLLKQSLDEKQSQVSKLNSLNVEKEDVGSSTLPLSSSLPEKLSISESEPPLAAAPQDLLTNSDQEVDALLLQEVEEMNIDPEANSKLDPYTKEDLELQPESHHLANESLDIAPEIY
ncbi:hypothetical protein F5050DRAFT_1716699, partial [Lentinula boryana]